VTNVKRLMGAKYSDPMMEANLKLIPATVLPNEDGVPEIEVVGYLGNEKTRISPEEVSAAILSELKRLASEHLGEQPTKAVITVPAHFNDGQREATAKAGKIAGLEVLKMINEPTAAALAYGLSQDVAKDENKKILVFDLGGGTLDVTILVHKQGAGGQGFFNAETTEGDTHLGGEDFTRAIVEHCRDEFRKSSGYNL